MAKSRKRFKNKRHFRPFGVLFRLIAVVFATALLIAYVSIYINPAKFWLPCFFGLYYIPILAANIAIFILAILRRSKSAWIPIIAILPSLLFFERYYKVGSEEIELKSSPYKIISYNVGQFASSRQGLPTTACRDSIINFIERERADVVCFQEFSIPDTNNIHNLFPEYPHKQFHFFKIRSNYYFGSLTISKYPIVSKGTISFKGSTNLSIYSDISCNNEIIRVYNNHLESYNLGRIGYDKFSNEFVQVHGKMKVTNQKRAHQVDEVMSHIQKCNSPFIICGDFNDTPMSYTYHKLSKLSKDTFVEAGNGFSATFSRLWPLLRIDFILIPQSFDVKCYNSPRIRLSDHYPISAIIGKSYD